MLKYNILLALTGSIACYKTCHLISRLRKEGHNVKVVATPSALKFIGTATIEGLSGNKVYTDSFEPGHSMDHINLVRWCDAFVIAPATAKSINALSSGTHYGILGDLYLALEKDKPVIIAPAMNSQMLSHPTVINSIQQLQDRGNIILNTDSGTLACGEEGYGKLINPDLIYAEILSVLQFTERPKVLVTSGGTIEPIDDVRCITNFSTGSTGATIVDTLFAKKVNVTHLLGQNALPSKNKVNSIRFTDFKDLNNKLKHLLSTQEFQAIIHLAAVSDFSVLTKKGKISSSQEITLDLTPNFKIVEKLKSYSKNKSIKIIAFKLTSTHEEDLQKQAVDKLLAIPGVNTVVHNDILDIKNNQVHEFKIFSETSESLFCAGKTEMANKLYNEVII